MLSFVINVRVPLCECELAYACSHVCFSPHVCVRVPVCVCMNSKLTAAVKFLSEHHRGEADGG